MSGQGYPVPEIADIGFCSCKTFRFSRRYKLYTPRESVSSPPSPRNRRYAQVSSRPSCVITPSHDSYLPIRTSSNELRLWNLQRWWQFFLNIKTSKDLLVSISEFDPFSPITSILSKSIYTLYTKHYTGLIDWLDDVVWCTFRSKNVPREVEEDHNDWCLSVQN